MGRPSRYSPEIRERSVRLVLEQADKHASQWAAIVGAISGAAVGATGIPEQWVAGIVDWPRTPVLMHAVAERLVRQQDNALPLGRVRYCWPDAVPRNLLFTVTVLLHGLRRLVPV